MTDSVLTQLSMLPDMDIKELESIWHNLFEEPPANTNKTHLIRKIAWRIQEMAYGGLSEDTQSKIKKLQVNPEYGSKRKKGIPPVGTQFVREHDGVEHRVMVLEDGFEYQSCKYKATLMKNLIYPISKPPLETSMLCGRSYSLRSKQGLSN